MTDRVDPDPFARIAQVIAGPGRVPPPYLAGNLRKLAPLVKAYSESDQRAPLRAVTRDRLVAVAKAAKLLAEELADPTLSVFLDQADEKPLRPDGEALARHLLDVRDRAMGQQLDGPGRGRAAPQFRGQPPMAIEGRQLAAFIIAEAWDACCGSKPKEKDAEAAKAAHMLWREATGAGATGWSHYFAALRKMCSPDDPRCGFLSSIRVAIRNPIAL